MEDNKELKDLGWVLKREYGYVFFEKLGIRIFFNTDKTFSIISTEYAYEMEFTFEEIQAINIELEKNIKEIKKKRKVWFEIIS